MAVSKFFEMVNSFCYAKLLRSHRIFGGEVLDGCKGYKSITWLMACEVAGLETTRSRSDYTRISDEDLLEDMKYVSILLSSKAISTQDYIANGKYKVQTILNRFSTWSEALARADLEQTGFRKISDNDLFNEIEKMWIQKGKQPTVTDIKNGFSQYSLNTYTRRFGGWRAALIAFLDYVNSDISENELLQEEILNIVEEDIKVNVQQETKEVSAPRRKTPRDINYRLRFKVMQRDNFKCRICGTSPAKDPVVVLHVDHIIPWSKGGETKIDNLQTLCSTCNLGKSNL